jgi:hypothetical protein
LFVPKSLYKFPFFKEGFSGIIKRLNLIPPHPLEKTGVKGSGLIVRFIVVRHMRGEQDV